MTIHDKIFFFLQNNIDCITKNFKDNNKTIIEWECWSRFFPRFILLLYISGYSITILATKKQKTEQRKERIHCMMMVERKKSSLSTYKGNMRISSKTFEKTQTKQQVLLFVPGSLSQNKNKLKSKLFHMERK